MNNIRLPFFLIFTAVLSFSSITRSFAAEVGLHPALYDAENPRFGYMTHYQFEFVRVDDFGSEIETYYFETENDDFRRYDNNGYVYDPNFDDSVRLGSIVPGKYLVNIDAWDHNGCLEYSIESIDSHGDGYSKDLRRYAYDFYYQIKDVIVLDEYFLLKIYNCY